MFLSGYVGKFLEKIKAKFVPGFVVGQLDMVFVWVQIFVRDVKVYL